MIFPEFIDRKELLGLSRQLLLDIFRVENVFEIHPSSLEDKPLIDDIRNVTKSLFPVFDIVSDLDNML